MTDKISARVHVLLAQNSPQAIVIRRGPSKQVAVIGWDRSDDSFTVGQWLKGRIYPRRCDISPDGSHWIYFAMDKHSQTYTVVAKVPYLKAIDFYSKNCAWNGGGLFASDKSYWLNDGGNTKHKCERHNSEYTVLPKWKNEPEYMGECPLIYFYRLERDDWKEVDTVQHGNHWRDGTTTKFWKKLSDTWQLWKLFHAGVAIDNPIGKGSYFESHMLRNAKTGEEFQYPDMEWADVDRDRIVWAENGKIMTAKIGEAGLIQPLELLDTNQFSFEEKVAPY